MQRKYIYILVFILTITLVLFNHYQEQKKSEKYNINNKDILEATYNSIELNSPLVIKNTQNDDEIISYTYNLQIENAIGAFKYDYNGSENYLVFSAIGETQITLKSNEFITIYDLPNGSKYKIEQLPTANDNYTTEIENKKTTIAEGILSLENNIVFNNETKIVNEPVKKNPLTNDNYILTIICFILSIIILISSRKIKITRFE